MGITRFLREDGTWVTPAGVGDMVLATAQTNVGLKTFLDGSFGMRNVLNTFTALFTNSITAARTYTLQDASGTIAFTSNITGTNSGTNTGDQTITLTGPVTGIGTGSFATAITADAVTNAILANMAANSFKVNNTGIAADPIDATAAQATAMLDAFIASGASGKKGLVPDPGVTAGTTRYLREDSTWVVPPAGGGTAEPLIGWFV